MEVEFSAGKDDEITHRTRRPLEMEPFVVDSHQQTMTPSPTHRRRGSTTEVMGKNVLMGLSVAGVALSLLTTVFGMFHVDVFLQAYQLPLPVFSLGSVVFSVLNTANNLAVAWWIDHTATTTSRSDLIGLSGCLFTLAFLIPFFRLWETDIPWLAGLHFVLSLSIFDALQSLTSILMSSVVTDNHHLSQTTRVQFMASGKVCNLIASFVVARIGLAVFETDMKRFRIFLLILASIVGLLFLIAQAMISQSKNPFQNLFPTPSKEHHSKPTESKLRLYQVAKDFWQHRNFKAWIGMEMLLEAQCTFMSYFLKTFVDQLLLDGIGREDSDWIVSMIRPMTQIAAIFAYIPIRHYGYPNVYKVLFAFNIILSLSILSVANESSSYRIMIFLCTYPVITGAIQSAGFDLAQADLVLEMKRKHALEGRYDEPSLAGLFMGANALLCKPFEKVLPIAATAILHRNDGSKQSLFYLLVIPPLVCAVLQSLSWRNYDLNPVRTAKWGDELKEIRHKWMEVI